MKLFKNKKKQEQQKQQEQQEQDLNEYLDKLNESDNEIREFICKFINKLYVNCPSQPFSNYFRRTIREEDLFKTIYTGIFNFEDEEFNNVIKERLRINLPKVINWIDFYNKRHNIFFNYQFKDGDISHDLYINVKIADVNNIMNSEVQYNILITIDDYKANIITKYTF